ncbi:MAG: catalase/peroxidase HPI, partial [Oscillospiraceae bacterium]|nr:catalase/peroxidase HPI [Oscillospiraceae bacterium]
GREDVWEPQEDIYWGSESVWLGDTRHHGDDHQLESPLAAVQMGLIYVNPEGPHGNPDPVASAADVRETFARMGMNDEETVALVAGGHSFGKAHGAASPKYLGREPEGAPIQEQGLGWKNSFGKGNAQDTISSGIEGAWKPRPTTWDMGYLRTLLNNEWTLTKSPAGAKQWYIKDCPSEYLVADAHIPGKTHSPMMTTADLALKFDPAYTKIAWDYLGNPVKFKKAFSQGWYKLTHRDMGPKSLYFGALVPRETLLWQDPIPKATGKPLTERELSALKQAIGKSGLSVSQLVSTAWASAASFRGSDKRGGANGARVRLEPQISWEVNQPERLKVVLAMLTRIQKAFNTRATRGEASHVSLADLIVLGGAVGIEKAAAKAGVKVTVPFEAGRTDASQAETDIKSFSYLQPIYDGFRNYEQRAFKTNAETLLVDRAQLLNLTVPEMTVLVGGLRVLGNNYEQSPNGVFTHAPETLTNDFFVNLLDMATVWSPTSDENLFEGRSRESGALKWTATRVDLIFGSNAQLRAAAEVYACADSKEKFRADFIAAWNKVMNADRFDLRNR